MESHRRGELTEAIAIRELKRRGIPVSTPFGDNERYDVVVEAPDGNLLKVQIKTGWLSDGVVSVKGKSQHTNATGNVYEKYEGDVDYVLAYCYEHEDLYWIHEDEIDYQITLRVTEPEVDHHTINWAEEYEFDERWPPGSGPSMGSRSNSRSPTVDRVIDCLEARDVPVATLTSKEHPRDLLAGTPGGEYVRIRVRTGYLGDGVIQHEPDDGGPDPDYLAIYEGEHERLYLVPNSAYGSTITLRVAAADQDDSRINWAEDYEFGVQWPPEE